MVGKSILRISKIYLTHFNAPLIDHRVGEPILEHLRIALYKRFSANPCLSWRSTYSIADQTNRHIKIFTEHPSEMICHGTESSYIILIA